MDDEAFMSDIENLSLFVKTFKRDYARLLILPDAETVIALLPAWFENYNEVHPHRFFSGGPMGPHAWRWRPANPIVAACRCAVIKTTSKRPKSVSSMRRPIVERRL